MKEIVTLVKEFTFEAAHRLPNVPAENKCRRLHGHSYGVEIHVTGEVDPRTGWLIDYADIKKAAGPVIERLDHRCLNELEGLENPTSERIAAWIWERVAPSLPGLSLIVIHETSTSRCLYRGPAGNRSDL